MALSQHLVSFNPFHEHHARGLAQKIADLTRELRPFAQALSRQSGVALEKAEHSAGELAQATSEVAHSAGELAHDFAERITPVAREVGRQAARQAQVAGRMLKNDPVPAVVAIGTALLLARLLMGRRRS